MRNEKKARVQADEQDGNAAAGPEAKVPRTMTGTRNNNDNNEEETPAASKSRTLYTAPKSTAAHTPTPPKPTGSGSGGAASAGRSGGSTPRYAQQQQPSGVLVLPASGERPKIMIKPPIAERMNKPSYRFRFVMGALVQDLEMPIERSDLLFNPNDARFDNGFPVALQGRLAIYELLLHNKGAIDAALSLWLGTKPIEHLRVALMQFKIAEAGMEVNDFSKNARAMLPLLSERWRADAQTITTLMREIAVFREEKRRKLAKVASLAPDERKDREDRINYLRGQLGEIGLTVQGLPWTGPEPTRLTYNRLVENGDEKDPELDWKGLAPQSTLERWDCGIRRVALERALTDAGYDVKTLMEDEKLYARMVVYIEMGFSRVSDVVEAMDILLESKQTQWTRPKRRTSRFAFNFALEGDSSLE